MKAAHLALALVATAESGDRAANRSPWLGSWRHHDQTIDIGAAGHGRLTIDGQGYWGGDDEYRRVHLGVHQADFSVEVASHSGQLRFAVSVLDGTALPYDSPDSLCHLTLRLSGNRLLVENPDECGGQNVSFAGVYRRAGAPPPPAARARRP